jgi:hypothetical protein
MPLVSKLVNSFDAQTGITTLESLNMVISDDLFTFDNGKTIKNIHAQKPDSTIPTTER